jgi:hypothetical protein
LKCITGFPPRPNFFARFRVVAAGYLDYSDAIDDESPVYDECPGQCPEYGDERRTYCDNCPIGFARDAFKETTSTELAEMAEKEPAGEKFGFDYLYQCLIDALIANDIPPDLVTMTTARLRGIIDGERNRIKRLKQWNKEQAADAEKRSRS